MVMVEKSLQTESTTRDNSAKARQMDRGFSRTSAGASTRVNGVTISNTVSVRRSGIMEMRLTRENFSMAKRMAEDVSSGRMALSMRVTL